MNKVKIGVCDWCRNIIKPGDRQVQTSSVDYADVVGGARVIASKVRSFHTPDCYREHLAWVREHSDGGAPDAVASAIREEVVEGDVGNETFEWSRAFDMTAEEALSGTRRTFRKAG